MNDVEVFSCEMAPNVGRTRSALLQKAETDLGCELRASEVLGKFSGALLFVWVLSLYQARDLCL